MMARLSFSQRKNSSEKWPGSWLIQVEKVHNAKRKWHFCQFYIIVFMSSEAGRNQVKLSISLKYNIFSEFDNSWKQIIKVVEILWTP